MPKVNRIRVTNLKLDKGDKAFGDKIFRLYGNNSLFILENGGGKSSLIQLILQVVLPNYGIDGKKLKDNVRKGSTIHIAVEWIPDDENYGKFITGFSFHNYGGKMDGNPSKKTYEYFNYLIDTDFEGAPKLEELKFVKDGKVIGTDEFKRDIKKSKGVHVRDTNSEYQGIIRQYGLVESEWKSIAKVNLEEGGVKEFFEKAETTTSLIEKLFIPSLLESLFENDKERKAILVAFKRYKDSLLELPKLEKDLNDFKVVTNHSDVVIDACKEYNQVLHMLKESKRGLAQLYKMVQQSSEASVKWLTIAHKELVEMERTEKDLKWKLASYEIFLTKEDMKKLKSELEDWDVQIDSEKKAVAYSDRKVKEQTAAKLYEEYRTHKANANKAESSLMVMSLENNEKSEQLQKSRKTVSENYRYLFNQNAKEQGVLHQERKDQIGIEKEAKQTFSQSSHQRGLLVIEKTQNELFLSQHEEDEIKLKQALLSVWQTDIPQTKNHLIDSIKEKKIEEKNLEETLTRVENEIIENEKRKTNCANDIKEVERSFEKTEKDFEILASKESELKNKISAHLSIFIRENLFEDRDRIVNNLESRKRNLESESIKCSIEMGHLDQIKNSIEQRGYHVNSELEAVKDFLIKKGIDVVLGIDLLTKLALSNEQKKELVKKNPLLTFAIAIEQKQLVSIQKALEGYKKELSIPILFIERAELENQDKKEMIFLLENHLHVFHRFHTRFNPSDWEQYTTDLEKEISRLNKTKVDLSAKTDELQQLHSKLNVFWNQYSSVTRQMFGSQLKEWEKQLTEKKGELSRLNNQTQENEAEKEKAKKYLKNVNDLMVKLDKKITLIQQFNERYMNIGKAKEQLAEVSNSIELLDKKIQNATNVLEKCQAEKEKIGGLLHNLDLAQKNLERDKTEYQYIQTEEERMTTLEKYEKNKSEYNALRKQMSGEEERMEELRENIENYNSLAKKMEEQIQKVGFNIESILRMGIVYDPSLLEQFEADLQEVQERLTQLTQSRAGTQKKYDSKETEVKVLVKKLKEGDEQIEPYEYGSSYESEFALISEELKQSISKMEEKIQKINLTKDLENENQVAIEELNASKDLMLEFSNITAVKENDWRTDKPIKLVRNYKKEILNRQEQLKDKQIRAKKSIELLMEEVEKTNNHTIVSMTRDLTRVLESTKDDYEKIISTFVLLLDEIKHFEETIEISKKQTETGRDLLIDLMYERAELLHRNILEIQKSTQVESGGEVLTYFRFNWPKKEDEDIKRQLRDFVDGILMHLTSLQVQGVSNDEMDKEFEKRADMINILNCYADISRCKIETLKPRNELLAAKKEWELWDRTKSWSNGELHATRMSMFIGFNSHLRKKRYSRENAWKFLLVDNPFGEASSDHVVKPMIDLANKSHTQLFCFTGIKDKSIQEEFETVIHNKYILQRDILFLDSKTEYKKEEDQEAALLEVVFYAK
ncbi:hypothetical protein BGM26_04170 [Bacillus sp. FJAT-29790]|uniref:hypothetical protein n=1 Tax=Bacillus sp. FJAT-29790 TaxID=1895002 RepID=UPI001C221006|nr:hypothetical protein [Bacillus sp. FJAT-29790]MBU8878189.1 hypothetical protein [Bacillus sp. FJAT-29790]